MGGDVNAGVGELGGWRSFCALTGVAVHARIIGG